jgi:asparagine synthase (glutamine-hydrolysing)
MCGIFGVASPAGHPIPDYSAELRLMRDALRHRGPDGDGLCRAPGAAIGMTRLRVMDLDARADQPFEHPSGVMLASNGEIYNAPDLRRRYPRHPFRSRSDAETLVPLYLDGGATRLADAVGMFAIAIWDGRHGRLTLARDRAGEKPLFWAEHRGAVWFASEIGALLDGGIPACPLDRAALAEYLRLGYVREPRTLHRSIHKVPAGTILTFDATGLSEHRYWDPVPTAPLPHCPAASDIRRLLEDAVTRQLAADVPIGMFISGGLDSSLLAAIAVRALGPGTIRSFSVGFPDPAWDERPWARRLARALGMPHQEVEVSDAEVAGALDLLATTGEPLGDPAAIPTLILSRAARADVTVVLSGEGGDELFGGYPTYLGHRWAGTFNALPRPARRLTAAVARALAQSRGPVPMRFLVDQFLQSAALPWQERHEAWFGTGLASLGLLDLGARREAAARPSVVEDDAMAAASGGGWPSRGFTPRIADEAGAAMLLDYQTALRDRLLVKIDRATMLASLESRAPFLDPDLTRAALAAPGRCHVGPFGTKRLLRKVARDMVPRFILRRAKRGLSAPVARWLAGPLAGTLAACRDLPRLTGGLVSADGLAGLMGSPAAVRRHARALWPLVALRGWMRARHLEEGTLGDAT